MREKERKSTKFARALRKDMTRAETLLWYELKNKCLGGLRFRRQFPIGPYITDFACIEEKLIVEIDGATHSTDAEIAHDAKRTAFLEFEGWRVFRVSNDDVFNNRDNVKDHIYHLLT